MIQTFTLRPRTDLQTNEPKESRVLLKFDHDNTSFEYTIAYAGPYTYSWETHVDNNVHVCDKSKGFSHNFHIGNGCSIGSDLRCVFARNHNIRKVSSGALETHFNHSNIPAINFKSDFHQKGSIVIQNDVWIGDNVTIMPGVVVRNGAVIAQNAHVVKDVPAYAVVGGNPAKIIGWRYPKEVIDKLQTIQWWYWNHWKILDNYKHFTEDVEEFCNKFYDDAQKDFSELIQKRNVCDDAYFTFVDYYENYSSYSNIIDEFLTCFVNDSNKRLILFIQSDCEVEPIKEELLHHLQTLCKYITDNPAIKAKVELIVGNRTKAIEVFLQTSHYLISRTFDTVYFTCLADRLGIEIISGVDRKINFYNEHNIYQH